MADSTTGLPHESRRIDEVEQVLEQAGIGALVDRRPDDERIGVLDRLQDTPGRQRKLIARPGRAEAGPGIDDVEQADIGAEPRTGRLGHRFDERPRLGGTLEIGAEADDAGERA